MFSVVAYGRVFARAIANTLAQGDLDYQSIVSSWPIRFTSRFFASQPAIANVHKPHPCHLVSAVCGFSKLDSLSRNISPASKPASAALLDKRLYGDDACFVAKHNSTDVLGVADGVGGWRAYGVDPSMFSRKLMETCETLVKMGKFVPSDPVDLLAMGFQEMSENKVNLVGSSTACIVMLDRLKKTLHAANLGDSGFMVVRKGKIIHRSTEQQHFFNSPFQLSIPPVDRRGEVHSDMPEDAAVTSFQIELGDIILTATDGLFDNMDDHLILRELSSMRDYKYETLKSTATKIANQAHKLSFDPEYLSPFAKQAKENGYDVTGGKPDDITVLLSLVTGG